MSTITPHPVDSTGITQGSIPDDALDALIAATIPAADDDTPELVGTPAHDGGTSTEPTEGATMTTTTRSDVSRPAGADEIHPFKGDQRRFFGPNRHGAQMIGDQGRDGAILGAWVGIDYPVDRISADEARELGAALTAAAGELDALNAGVPNGVPVPESAAPVEAVGTPMVERIRHAEDILLALHSILLREAAETPPLDEERHSTLYDAASRVLRVADEVRFVRMDVGELDELDGPAPGALGLLSTAEIRDELHRRGLTDADIAAEAGVSTDELEALSASGDAVRP